MKDIEQGNVLGSVVEITPLELWNDKNVVSMSFRRHTLYDYAGHDPVEVSGGRPKGAITPMGIYYARREAKRWHDTLPLDSNVVIFESPSFMPAGERESPRSHLFLPSRARQTASIYETEVFGDQAMAEEVDDSFSPIQSKRRKRAYLLGDFMEQVTKEGALFIDNFFKTRSEVYGNDMTRFWSDYIKETLDSRVEEALKKCAGSGSRDLALNLVLFLKENTGNDKDTDRKTVDLAITHGETMSSFLHHANNYLRDGGGLDADLNDVVFDYNQGFDAHLKEEDLYIQYDMKVVKVGKIQDFINYLKSRKKSE